MAKHDFYLNEYGDVDIWRMDAEYHNGPQCRRCNKCQCHHCYDWTNEECLSEQGDLF